jgi:hypothetical protein
MLLGQGNNPIIATASGTNGQILLVSNGAGALPSFQNLSGSGFFINGGNAFGATASLGLTDANQLNIITNNITRMSIASGGAISVAAPTTGTAFSVTGNSTSTAATITPGSNQIGLSIGNSGTATGLQVNRTATINSGGTFPLFAGGSQTTAAAFTGLLGNTTAVGTLRVIWANLTSTGAITLQSGGITNVTKPGTGTYNITFSAFSATPVVIATAINATSGFVANAASPTTTSVTIRTVNSKWRRLRC